jgi:four helix bundle protein
LLFDRAMRQWILDLENRTKRFAVDVVRCAMDLQSTQLPRAIVWQFTDSGTSVGANHRACRRARSTRELTSKLSVVDEEADESVFWLEVMIEVLPDSELRKRLQRLLVEASELRAIFASGRRTAGERSN